MSDQAARDLSREAAEEAERERRAHERLAATVEPFLHADFFFVNIGANDGVTKDPIYRFLETHRWRGIAVEPVPYVFERLKANLEGIAPQVTLVNAAISDTPRRMWIPPERDGTFSNLTTQIGSFDRDLAQDNLRFLTAVADGLGVATPSDELVDELVPIEVDCVSFNRLMEQHGVDHVDLLNIDAEGADFEILQSIDLDRYCPNVLCIEVSALPKPQRVEVKRVLDERGLRIAHQYGPFTAVYVRHSDPG